MSTHTEASHTHTEDPRAEAGAYLRTLILLLILTGITVGAASFDFGSGNVVIALAIASVKATLVALFFMHLRHDKPVNGVIAAAGFLFLGIFLMFCLIDADTRDPLQPVNLKPMPLPGAVGSTGAPGASGAPAPAPAAAPAAEKH